MSNRRIRLKCLQLIEAANTIRFIGPSPPHSEGVSMIQSAALRILAVTILAAWSARLPAAEIRMPRHPDYSEGRIAFSYLGDLWLVNDDGMNPRRLTVHAARDSHPKFSPDGKWIAFSSNRYGNDDVFVMPSIGGEAKRLTYNTASDTVAGWSRDSKRIVFSSSRGRVFPGIPSLYEVPREGGPELPMPMDWGTFASYSPDGRQVAYNRHPATWSRKHYRGSYAADLWVCNLDTKSSHKVLDANLPDDQKPNNFWPMYGNDGIYFVSDRETMAKAGSPEVMKSANNIWRLPADGGPPVQITHHTSGSLFWPSISADGRTIVYEEGFGLWKLDVNNGKPIQLKIDIATDWRENNQETKAITSEADSYNLSPSGKRAVISVEGELFTIATDKGDIHRIIRTPGARETAPQWSPDGKWIAFISDQNGREEIWLCDERGQHAKSISNLDCEKSQPVWSPDSKALVFSAGDKKLYKYTIDGNKTDVITSGEVVEFGNVAVGRPQWSPDGKWLSYTKADPTLLPHVYVIPSSGGQERRITGPESYSETNAWWTPDGKRLVYLAGSDVGNIGAANRNNTAQIYSIALMPEEHPPGNRGVDNESEAASSERTSRPARPRDADGDEPAGRGKVDVKINFDNMSRRTKQLTRSADTILGLAISPDSKSIAFITSGIEGGRPVSSIWTTTIDGERVTRITQQSSPIDENGPPAPRGGMGGGYSSLQYSKDGRTLYFRQGRGIYAHGVSGGPSSAGSSESGPRMTRRPAESPAAGEGSGAGSARRVAFTAKVEIDHAARRRQVFDESWRVMKNRFYDATMHGVDWDAMRRTYEPLLPFIAEQEDLHDVVNMMIGEINASHTGISGGFRSRGGESAEQIRFAGFDVEPAEGHWRVTHVYRHGPADKDYVKLKVGDYILAVDGQELKSTDNYWKALAGASGTKFEFTVNSKPEMEGSWTTKITPVSSMQLGTFQYDRWVDERRAQVEKLSGGKIGYLHIRQMNDGSLRQFERDFATNGRKQALIVDQRFNPGGNIDQELLEILGQKQYQFTRQRNSIQVPRPLRGFFGPMVVMENERSTSDAEVFPDGFRTLKLGKIVGVTTYGAVIGTGSYTLMDGSSLRTPGSGLWNVSGQNLENYGVPPDVYVDNTPDDFLKGRDAQLEKAVDVLMQELKNGKK